MCCFLSHKTVSVIHVSCQINNVPVQAYTSNLSNQFSDVSSDILYQVHIPHLYNKVSPWLSSLKDSWSGMSSLSFVSTKRNYHATMNSNCVTITTLCHELHFSYTVYLLLVNTIIWWDYHDTHTLNHEISSYYFHIPLIHLYILQPKRDTMKSLLHSIFMSWIWEVLPLINVIFKKWTIL